MGNNSNISNVSITVTPGYHTINRTVTFFNSSNIDIKGDGANSTIINCTNSSSIIFMLCSNVSLRQLNITNCGSEEEPAAAVLFSGGHDLTLDKVIISDSIQAAFLARNIQGTIFVKSSIFQDTEPRCTDKMGTGVVYENCNNSQHNKLLVYDSTFSNHKYSSTAGNSSGFYVQVDNSQVSINITKCKFTDNTDMSQPGGNLKILLHNISNPPNSIQVRVHIDTVNITNGNAEKGGGMYLYVNLSSTSTSHSTPSHFDVQNCTETITLKNVQFKYNSASILAGGLYISNAESKAFHNCQGIRLTKCKFSYNEVQGKGGAALHNNNYILPSYIVQQTPQYQITLEHCNFIHNGYKNHKTTKNSVIIINANKKIVIDSISANYNNCNGITAINSNLIFQGSTSISYNNGTSGGGLLLCENAILFFHLNTYLEIAHNHVDHAGGGICVEPQCLEANPRCFFQLLSGSSFNLSTHNNVTVNLTDNNAGYAGHNLYGGDVDRCYLLDSSKPNKVRTKHGHTEEKVFKSIFKYDNNTSSVTSPPRTVILDKNKTTTTIYPHQSFNICSRLEGQLHGIVPGVVVLNVIRELSKYVSLDKKTYKVECHTTCQPFYITSSHPGKHEVKIILTPEYSGDESGYKKLFVSNETSFNITLEACPLGSYLNSNQCQSAIPHTKLDMENKQPRVNATQNRMWYKIIDHQTVFYRKFCAYCKPQCANVTPGLGDPCCDNHRTGILCGNCSTNYSMMLGTSKCGECKGINILMLFIMVLAGVGLVLFLAATNLTIAQGMLSGLIFYANTIESNSFFLIPIDVHKHTYTPYVNFLRVFIGWLNLDLAIPNCFYDGMTAYHKAWLEFVFPIYIWILALLVVFLNEKCQCVARIASRNATQVLATLVLLSYTRFLRAIIFSFAFVKYTEYNISDENCTSKESRMHWLTDSNIEYWRHKHIILLAFSFLFAAVSLPFTFTLLCIRHLHKHSHRRLLRWVARLKPFLDAFVGPYTDNGRFWPGLLLVARIATSIITGINTFSDQNITLHIILGVIVVLLAVAALVRPGLYINRKLDWLEFFFLFNLAFLCLQKTYDTYFKTSWYEFFFSVFVTLALLVFCGIVCLHIHVSLRKCKLVQAMGNYCLRKFVQLRSLVKRSDHNQTLTNYPPHDEFVHQREPLIEDHEE